MTMDKKSHVISIFLGTHYCNDGHSHAVDVMGTIFSAASFGVPSANIADTHVRTASGFRCFVVETQRSAAATRKAKRVADREHIVK